MNDIRQRMLEGKQVEGCEKCYHEESLKYTSQRQLLNQWFSEWLINDNLLPWKEDSDSLFEEINDLNWVEIFKNTPIKLQWLALHGSNICNLACRGCYSLLSTKWRKDEIKLGINPHPTNDPDIDWYGIDIASIDFITMFGGEPFYMKQSEQLIDKVEADPNNKILQYFTNGTVMPSKQTLDVWKDIRKLILYISVDAFGEDNDYFRYGSDWNTVEQNLQFYISEGAKYNWEIKVSTLINIYNVDKLDVLHNWLVNKGIQDTAIMYNLCIYPQELDIRNLPQEYKEELIEQYSTINLPNNVKSVVQKHLEMEPNLSSFIVVKAFSEKLDELRDQHNPNIKLERYIKNDSFK